MLTGVDNEPLFSIWHHALADRGLTPPLLFSSALSLLPQIQPPVFISYLALQTHWTCWVTLDPSFLIYKIRWLAQIISKVPFSSNSLRSTIHGLQPPPSPQPPVRWSVEPPPLSSLRAWPVCVHVPVNWRYRSAWSGEGKQVEGGAECMWVPGR